jgi:23S rRNA pseudouridine1911/1915/1917 synthase
MKSSDSVIYSDNHILVANKPAGWLTQPDDTGTMDLETQMKEWVKNEFHKPGAVFLHVVHRIDRPVSGLVLFARTSKALSRLNEQIRAGAIRRIYIAEVEGILPQKEGELEHYIAHGDHRAIISSQKEAKLAQLFYRVEEFKEHSTRVAIELKTGRYHQIRAQFSAIGHPVVGDIKYGAGSGDGRTIRLHSATLILAHPVTKEELRFDLPPPF